MISRVQSYQKLQKKFPVNYTHLECDTVEYRISGHQLMMDTRYDPMSHMPQVSTQVSNGSEH